MGFRRFRAISMVADEVGFRNSKSLQVFASTFLAGDVSFGVCLPPQLMPAMHVDFAGKPIQARIQARLLTAFGNGGRGGRGRGGRGRVGRVGGRAGGRGGRAGDAPPKADPLVSTWHVAVGLDNALSNVLPQGLRTFLHRPANLPRQPGDPYELQPVLSFTSDQDSTLFATHVILCYSESMRMVWFPGCCHQESNTASGTMTASGLGHLAEKVNFLAKFNHGPYRGGRWLGVQKMAAEAFVEAVRADQPVAVNLLRGQIAAICEEQGWPGPQTPQAWNRTQLRSSHGLIFLFFPGYVLQASFFGF